MARSSWLLPLLALLAATGAVSAAKKGKESESVIEDVNAKQFERLLEEKDYVAVFWCKCYSYEKQSFRLCESLIQSPLLCVCVVHLFIYLFLP